MTTINLSSIVVELGRARVLDDVSFSAEPGEVISIVGPNGAGKTTLLRVMAGELVPTSGAALLGDADPAGVGVSERATMRSVLTQTERDDVPYTVRTVVGFGTFNTDLFEEERLTLVEDCLRRLELDDIADRRISDLSGGERRRAAIARTLAQRTPVMLLDEPTDSLDLRHAGIVSRIGREEAASGTTVVSTGHDLNLAARFADRIVMLNAGSIVADGSPHDVLTAEQIEAVYECPVYVSTHPEDNGPVIYL